MRVIRTIHELRSALKLLRDGNKKVALIPTMGALHKGHLSLINIAAAEADVVIASIFVNPAQFGPSEDYGSYPRTETEDLALLSQQHVDIAYLPAPHEMYKPGFSTSISVTEVSSGLCGDKRPGHFDGVALVVTKLFMQVAPDIAIFGEKDFQQLQVLRKLVSDLDIAVTILGAPIYREADGLALSSRNRYLNETQRLLAPELYKTLNYITAGLIKNTGTAEALIQEGKEHLLSVGFDSIDYIELRNQENLIPVEKLTEAPARLLAAAFLGKCRLIDNVAVIPQKNAAV